jgi:hypothetical protein
MIKTKEIGIQANLGTSEDALKELENKYKIDMEHMQNKLERAIEQN